MRNEFSKGEGQIIWIWYSNMVCLVSGDDGWFETIGLGLSLTAFII